MNKTKSCSYKKNSNGFHSVNYDGVEVANALTWAQAIQLCDDLSYYGQAINCVYRKDKVCKLVETNCKTCSYNPHKNSHNAKE